MLKQEKEIENKDLEKSKSFDNFIKDFDEKMNFDKLRFSK